MRHIFISFNIIFFYRTFLRNLLTNFLSLVVILFILPITVYVYAANVTEYKLKNGLKIIIIEEHKSPVATFQIWYRVGIQDEPIGKSGITHFLEHMMFKGTPAYGPTELSRIIQKNGGIDNAYTTKEYTAYFELLPSNKIMTPIELEADRMKNLIIDPKETLSEKKVIMEERRRNYEDDPHSSLYEEVVATAFKAHPYQRPIIGWMSDISSIEREDLQDYYQKFYVPNNAVIVIAGDIKPEEMIKKIKSSFEDIPPGPVNNPVAFSEPVQKGERRLMLKREAELPYILIAYHAPNFPDEDSYALDVLDLILSGGKSSRLYRSLVYEKRIALDASSYYDSLFRDPYLFFLTATASPGKDIKDVEKQLYSEIEKIKKNVPSDREVQKAKNQIEASFIFDQDSIYIQAMNYAEFEMLGDWRLINRYLAELRKVTPQDVKTVAKKYLQEDNRTVGILIPIEKD